jgi:glycosyltransferase involved in cell wall biosynthesis
MNRCIQRSLLRSLVCFLEARRQRRNYRRVDRFVCPSRFLQAKVRGMGLPGRFTCIANFVELAPFSLPEPPAVPRVLFFGRLVEEKGVALLIAAMKGLPAECLIVGDGPEKKALQAQAAQSPEARVRFLGHRPFPELEPIIRGSSLVVVPSIWYENNPFAVIEAYALGVPVVAARIGGIPELVIDRETGLLFAAGNSAELREKILLLLGDPGLGRVLAANARRHLETNFSPSGHYEKLLGLYRELIAAAPAP